MKYQKGYTLVELVIVFVVFLGGIGWIMNIFALAHEHATMEVTMFILRIIGIFFFPLGIVLGYL